MAYLFWHRRAFNSSEINDAHTGRFRSQQVAVWELFSASVGRETESQEVIL